MGYKRTGAAPFEPQPTEVNAWREFAELSLAVVAGSRKWLVLKDSANRARKLTVFGHEHRGNTCICLIEKAVEVAESCDPHQLYPELDRLACEVLKRCNSFDTVKAMERRA